MSIGWTSTAEASWFLTRYYRGELSLLNRAEPTVTPEPTTPPVSDPAADEPEPINEAPAIDYGGWASKWLRPAAGSGNGASQPAPTPVEPTPTEPVDKPTAGATIAPASAATAAELAVLEMINEERRKAGLEPYQLDLTLTRLARMKAQDLVDNNVFSHESPTYGSPYDMLATYGVSYIRAGENLASAGNIYVAHFRLMRSSGHRRNILHPYFNHVGIGVVQNGGGVLIAQLFVEW